MDTMKWEDGRLLLLDQTRLPGCTEYISCEDHETVAEAIKRLSVRGAPAIGAAAAYGLVLGAMKLDCSDTGEFIDGVEKVAVFLSGTRPTAVNLNWALERMLARIRPAVTAKPEDLINIMLREAGAIYREDLEGNRKMGEYGLEVIPEGARILTHCNAGSLATAGYGTALGVIRAAHEAGKKVSVYADETRPLLQGARLTCWEMLQEGIPVTLITDNMAGHLMSRGMVDLVVVGSDRIAANGDVANKIGTYGVAVLAREHGLPFYVAAPFSTIDISLGSGSGIPIEERNPDEVTHIGGVRMAPEGVRVWNPAFDVTPARLVSAIITERGILRAPYEKAIRAMY
ncbi:MAG: methylthioribose-1-phosphate isomerase [Peptococcaceae bacterium BICA1-7]|nr:MAG: methylthioribose-1-phosphate isomerase [Peptococcaceae bacterium BICA1-7]HBV96482.1 S-methyl-5-thioribose-1-phosphate isomerase [Desulfotomaculum sp.]